jgi:DNA-binding NarL/FixJ family response regulator
MKRVERRPKHECAADSDCERYPNIQVLVLTNCDEYDLIRRALAAGAEGYLLKNSSADDLGSVIRMASAGNLAPGPNSFEDLARAAQTPALPPPPEPSADLTGREQEVLARMAHGLTNTQIGAHLSNRGRGAAVAAGARPEKPALHGWRAS